MNNSPCRQKTKKNRYYSKLLSFLLTFIMMLTLNEFNNLMTTTAFAVTGSSVAADGSYSGYSSEGTVTVTVSNGKIASVSANVKSKYQSYISSAFSSVIGKAATANNIDAVSSSTSPCSVFSSLQQFFSVIDRRSAVRYSHTR